MELSTVDYHGLTTLSFSHPVALLRNKTFDFNEEVFKMEVVSNLDQTQFLFDWRVTEFTPDSITFYLLFEYPLNVSLYSDEVRQQDLLILTVVEPELFFSNSLVGSAAILHPNESSV